MRDGASSLALVGVIFSHFTTLEPPPPSQVSLPLPPLMLSSPFPPRMLSLPPDPLPLSSPLPRRMLSFPAPPTTLSGPALPLIVSLPLAPFRLFAPLVPPTVSVPTMSSGPGEPTAFVNPVIESLVAAGRATAGEVDRHAVLAVAHAVVHRVDARGRRSAGQHVLPAVRPHGVVVRGTDEVVVPRTEHHVLDRRVRAACGVDERVGFTTAEVPVRRRTRRNGGAQVDVDQKVVGPVGVAQGVHAVSHVDLVGICDGRAVATLGQRVVACFQPVVVVLRALSVMVSSPVEPRTPSIPEKVSLPAEVPFAVFATRSTVTPSDRSK